MKKLLFFLLGSILLVMLSCRKDSFITSGDAALSFSSDTLHFDTVFTSVGSTTRYVKIFNNNNQKLKISRIRLAGGATSYYKTNIDGTAVTQVNNVELNANDSLYVFVTVRIDPTNAEIPFVIEDSLEITYNGNTRWVQLQAWGQNANLLRSHTIDTNTTWDSRLPYVILGGLYVQPGATLNITKGSRIFLHADAPIVVDGTLITSGDTADSKNVSFQSDRLDDPYSNFPASWPGIYFRSGSTNNRMLYTVIKNAYQGIVIEGPSANSSAKLILEQVVIDNAYDAGILAVRSSIQAYNTLVSNCGKGILLVNGGDYHFEHCTAVSLSTDYILHKDPVLYVANFIKQDNAVQTAPLNARFINSIFWGANGSVDNEVVRGREGTGMFNVSFEHCLWKVKDAPVGVVTTQVLNEDPQFELIESRNEDFNFQLKQSSPAIDKGKSTQLSVDLTGRSRGVRTPDLGAYERQ